jgi:hypothetical protein
MEEKKSAQEFFNTLVNNSYIMKAAILKASNKRFNKMKILGAVQDALRDWMKPTGIWLNFFHENYFLCF